VARIFGVPPHLIADASNSTSWGSGLAGAERRVRPVLAAPVDRTHRGRPHPAPHDARHAGRVREAQPRRPAAGVAEGALRGVRRRRRERFDTINECRKLEDKPPVPWGDEPWVPKKVTETGAPPTRFSPPRQQEARREPEHIAPSLSRPSSAPKAPSSAPPASRCATAPSRSRSTGSSARRSRRRVREDDPRAGRPQPQRAHGPVPRPPGNGSLRLTDDRSELAYEIDLPDTTAGRDAAHLLERGDIKGSSIGFRAMPKAVAWSVDEDGMALRSVSARRNSSAST
jgi:hypothetical protein